MKKFVTGLILGLLVLVAACNRFTELDAVFVAYNTSSARAEFIIDGSEKYSVEGNSSARFVKKVLVPIGSSTSPSYERTVQVSVAVKNMVTGELTRPVTCSSGAQVIAHLTYYKPVQGSGYVGCTSTW